MNQDSQYKSEESADQRYFPRWEVNNRVLFQLENQMDTFETQTVDLSCAGACLFISKSVKPNQKIKLVIYLSPAKFVNVNGHILWTKSVDGQLEAGVLFENIPPHTQDVILQHAFELRRDQVIRNWYKGWSG